MIKRELFINCPFSDDYKSFFEAIVFTTIFCGFYPRCAQESDDNSKNRLDKICDIIEDCEFGFHDISKVELDHDTSLPRFNMPLELGLFLAAKRFGGQKQKKKGDSFNHTMYISPNLVNDSVKKGLYLAKIHKNINVRTASKL